MRRRRLLLLFLLVCCVTCAQPARAYSLLTHEELIDLTWDSSIVPLLLSRYPTLTPAQLEHARAYAYGGCVIQDIGYYPFGDLFFSNLTHYVRSGDFVVNLFRNAHDADELAFAIGALSHYIGDSVGHSEATNVSVPVEFPRLRDRYGNVVTYAEGEHQHVQTEFAFDINDIAHGRLAPVHYLRHVGLEVPTQQVSIAFYQTYGLPEDFRTHRGARINVRAYRFAVHSFIPRIAYALNLLHRRHEPVDLQNADLQQLEAAVRSVEQKNQWDQYRRHAGIGTYSLAGLIFIVPKIGPLKLAAVKGPTSQTEVEYVHSVVASVDALDRALRGFTPPPPTRAAPSVVEDKHADSPAPDALHPNAPSPAEARDLRHPLPNRDLDTGYPVRPAGYSLTDSTYATLLHRIALAPSHPIPPGIKRDILAYYADPGLPFATKKDPGRWAMVLADLQTLQTIPTSTEPDPYPTYDASPAASPSPQ
jgi:hypothetical protein